MKFLLQRTSDQTADVAEIDVPDLESLVRLAREGCDLQRIIIFALDEDGDPPTIEIYDDWRE